MPKPLSPAAQAVDEELYALWDEIASYFALYDQALEYARAVLARYGSTPTPVPVAERLPGPEDCDAAEYARAALALAGPSDERIATLEQELERERIRLAACGVIAMADTPESAAEARKIDPCYHSASLDDVIRQVDALMAARAVIARYGSAPRPIPVAERPWERKGWCDEQGGFWAEHISRSDVPSWRYTTAESLGGWAIRCLPAHALPIPENADD